MLAVDLIQFLSQALFVIVFALTLGTAVRHPRPVTVEIAVLFGAAAANVTASWLFLALGIRQPPAVSAAATFIVLAIPYLLLRLVDEFAGVPALVQRLAELGLLAVIAARLLIGEPMPLWATELLVGYFAVVTLYVTAAFAREARSSIGVTARRLGSVATGSGLLATAILIAGFRAAFPGIIPPLSLLGGPLGLASGVAFYLGFATPRWVLRSWREPELLAFLDGADQLAAQSDVAGLLHELQSAVSGALGLRGAFVGLWHEDENVLEYGATRFTAEQIRGTDARLSIEGELLRTPVDVLIGGQCFVSQKPIYTENVEDLDPEHAGLYRALGVKVVIVAPMTVGSERYGVLGVFAPRTRLFAEDSLTRVQMLARNAAILLRSRRLLERAASVRVQEEVVRQKEDFLSSATHDLKTPLTSIKGVAQWIRRRASSDEAIDGAALESDLLRIENAAARMGGLIDEVLDISRLQMSRPLELQMDTTDLTALARKVAERQQEMTSRHRIEVQSAESVMGCWDQARLERVIDNLLSNAVKFSPQGGAVTVEVERESGEWAVLTVRDEGIGMRPGDAERIFGRFERGTNAAERGITGTGIGLSYVRQIVAAHGGEVSVQSADGAGSTFTVKLPVQNVPCAASKPQSESEEKASI